MKILTPRKAIRAHCFECANGAQEVMLCTDPTCNLYAHRFGRRIGKDIVYIKGSTTHYMVGGKEMEWIDRKGWVKPKQSYKEIEAREKAAGPK